MSSSSPRAPSPVALALGGLATVPFIAGAVLAWLAGPDWRPTIAQALSAYAAVVVSFIGALHWGFAFAQPDPAPRLFVWGVVPSIVAWIAVLTPPPAALVVHAAMLVVCYGVDRTTYPAQGVAAWLPLRLRLTLVATLACLVGAAAR